MNNIQTKNKEPLNPKSLKIVEVIVIVASFFIMMFSTLRYLAVIDRRKLKMTYGFFPNLIHPSNNFWLWLIFSIVWIAIIAAVCYLFSKSEKVRKGGYGIFKFFFHIVMAILAFYVLKFVIILLWVLTGHVVPPFP